MSIPEAVHVVAKELGEIFGPRLQVVLQYGINGGTVNGLASTLAIVDRLGADDLRACADHAGSWRESGVDTPLILVSGEFPRSLDTFPSEFGAILADYVVVSGSDPFLGLAVEPSDLRRACEVQVRSHLLHLRENYIETEGRSDVVAELIMRSAAPLATLLQNVARLRADLVPSGILTRVANLARGGVLTSEDARQLFPGYLEAVEQLTQILDRWGER